MLPTLSTDQLKHYVQYSPTVHNTSNGMPFTITVSELRALLTSADDDAVVYTERVEDVYFEKYGWTTEKVQDGDLDHEFITACSATYNPSTKRLYIFNHY